jgi:hypothetical protein
LGNIFSLPRSIPTKYVRYSGREKNYPRLSYTFLISCWFFKSITKLDLFVIKMIKRCVASSVNENSGPKFSRKAK